LLCDDDVARTIDDQVSLKLESAFSQSFSSQ
jgi:hypothetical protein